MPPGGARTGAPQTAYPGRPDLTAATQPVRSAKSVVQGDRKRREQAQAVMPLPATGRPPPPPGSIPSLTAPTERPNEPVTAGLPVGPGPGPEALGAPAAPTSDALFDLRALARRYPEYGGLMRAIALAEQDQ
jgi:hypothetical protein